MADLVLADFSAINALTSTDWSIVGGPPAGYTFNTYVAAAFTVAAGLVTRLGTAVASPVPPGGSDQTLEWTGTAPNDQWLTWTWEGFTGAGGTVRSYLRVNGGAYYVFSMDQVGNWSLGTNLGTINSGVLASLSIGDIFRFQVQATSLTVTQNGNPVTAATDASVASGGVAFRMESTVAP